MAWVIELSQLDMTRHFLESDHFFNYRLVPQTFPSHQTF